MRIVFEGCDSAGKSSSAMRIHEWMKDHLPTGYQVEYMHQPGDTPIGETLRHLVKDPDNDSTKIGNFYLMLADHSQFCKQKLKPLLDSPLEKDKYLILQDRHSAISGYVNGVARYNSVTDEEYRSAYGSLLRTYPFDVPDICINLMIPPDVIVENLKRRGFSASDRYEASKDESEWEKVEQGYKDVVTKGVIPSDRFIILNADKKKTVVIHDEVEALLGHKNMADGPIREQFREMYKYLVSELVEKRIDKNARRHDKDFHADTNTPPSQTDVSYQ